MLKEGDYAVDFTLPSSLGGELTLSDYKGRTIVLYFYPRDNTPGCTAEACSIRDVFGDMQAAGALVLGVSPDSLRAHASFREKFGLPFHLVSDAEHTAAKAYGAYGEKKLYGKTHMGILRSTFVIGPDFVIRKVFPKVSPQGHGEEILAALRALQESAGSGK